MDKLTLTRTSSIPLYQQIYAEIKKQIVNGRLQTGEQLPSYRAMCQRYHINLATVVHAYELLETEDLVSRRQGSGCYVLPRDFHRFFEDEIILSSFQEGQSQRGKAIDFATTTPSPDRDAAAALRGAIARQLQKDKSALFGYPPTQGAPALICEVRTLLAQRQVRVSEADIQIINGSQQGVDLICKALISGNSSILTEDPSYSVAVNTFLRYGASVSRVPLTQTGPDLSALEDLLQRQPIDFYYTTTLFQGPTNIVWDLSHRRRVLELAEKYDFTIIEDDCMGQLFFGGQPPLPLKAYDAGQRVFYLNSFSKSLMPGFRLGYLVVPPQHTRRILNAKFNSDIASPLLFQETMADLIHSGAYQQQLVQLRRVYKRKRGLMLREIRAARHLFPVYPECGGGVLFWLRLPEGIDSFRLYEHLAQVNIKILPSAAFSQSGRFPNYIRLSFVGCNQMEIEHGIATIDHLLEEAVQHPQASPLR